MYDPLNELPPPPVAVSVPVAEFAYPVPPLVIVKSFIAPLFTIWVGASLCHPPIGLSLPSENLTRLPLYHLFFA